MIRLNLLFISTVLMTCACAAPSQPVSPCSGHCITHEEGYQWAQTSNLLNDKPCDSYSGEFARGCRNGAEDLNQLRSSKEGL